MVTPAHETPTYPQYTNLALHDGLFDQLMAAHKYHLDIEWDAQRIRGDMYAKVYLGSMESVLSNTTQYLIGILLIDEKRENLIAQTNLIIQQTRLAEVETAKAQFELDILMPLQATKLESEIALLNAQKLLTDAQILLTNAQTDKTVKEIEYIDAKIMTERANTEDIAHVNSLIGRQVILLKAQKIGFAGDIQTKTAKLFADYDAVFQSVQEIPEADVLNNDAQTAINVAEGYAASIAALP
jgi:hypothetical protein